MPVNWDTHIDYLLSKVLYIIRICKYYGYSIENLDLLFQSLILSVFIYAIDVWGCGFYCKSLSRIDRCYKLGYCLKRHCILDIRRNERYEVMVKDLFHQHCVGRSFTSPENTADEN